MPIATASGNHLGKTVELVLDTDDSQHNKCIISMTLNYGSDKHHLSLIVSYNDPNPSLTIQANQLTGIATCLGGCGISAAAGPIAECIKRSKDIIEFKKCIKRKSITILSRALECLLGCLGGAIASAH